MRSKSELNTESQRPRQRHTAQILALPRAWLGHSDGCGSPELPRAAANKTLFPFFLGDEPTVDKVISSTHRGIGGWRGGRDEGMQNLLPIFHPPVSWGGVLKQRGKACAASDRKVFPKNIYLPIVWVCVCVWTHTCATHVEVRGEPAGAGSFHHVGSGDRIQVFRFGDKSHEHLTCTVTRGFLRYPELDRK